MTRACDCAFANMHLPLQPEIGTIGSACSVCIAGGGGGGAEIQLVLDLGQGLGLVSLPSGCQPICKATAWFHCPLGVSLYAKQPPGFIALWVSAYMQSNREKVPLLP